jgi:signal transduction histidine kinase
MAVGGAMVRAIVERHGGRVRVDPSDHGEARLVVSLPNGEAAT